MRELKQMKELKKAIAYFGDKKALSKAIGTAHSAVDFWLKTNFKNDKNRNIMHYNRALKIAEESNGKIDVDRLVPNFSKAVKKYLKIKREYS